MSKVDAYIAAAVLQPVELTEKDVWWTDTKLSEVRLNARYEQLVAAALSHRLSFTVAFVVGLSARGLGVLCIDDATLRQRAQKAIDEIDAEFERRRKSGDLKAINRNYRDARIRGQRVPNWSEWVKELKRRAYAEHAQKNRLKLLENNQDQASATIPGADGGNNSLAPDAN